MKIKIPVDDNGNYDLAAQQEIAELFDAFGELNKELQNKIEQVSELNINIPFEASTVKIKLIEVFDVLNGNSKFTKKYTQQHIGEYPLFSANNKKPFALIDSYDYDTPCLSWTIVGIAGYITCHKEPFSTTNNRGILKPKKNDIDIDYAKIALEPIFRENKKGRLGDKGQNEYTQLQPKMIKDIVFDVPVDNNGNFDLILQKEIAQKYATIEKYKKEIIDRLNILLKQNIEY